MEATVFSFNKIYSSKTKFVKNPINAPPIPPTDTKLLLVEDHLILFQTGNELKYVKSVNVIPNKSLFVEFEESKKRVPNQ